MIETDKHTYPSHGGDIEWAQQTFGTPADQWLDLSTGISPWPWPAPAIPEKILRNLPHNEQALNTAAGNYYDIDRANIVSGPGTQYFISLIPTMVKTGKVALPIVGYKEHARAWENARHTIIKYESISHLKELIQQGGINYCVIINPNNPSAEKTRPGVIRGIQQALQNNSLIKPLLIIDEAFIDLYPEFSLLGAKQTHSLESSRHTTPSAAALNNTIVLKSVGKFFGLAGIRLGFAIADQEWTAYLEQNHSPWHVSNPAQWIGIRALTDSTWISHQRERIHNASTELEQFLIPRYPNCTISNGGLFVSVFGDSKQLETEFLKLAHNAILVRYQVEPHISWLRFGLGKTSPKLSLQF